VKRGVVPETHLLLEFLVLVKLGLVKLEVTEFCVEFVDVLDLV
jgi:hypothetical protein